MDTTQIFFIAFVIFLISAFILVIGLALQRSRKKPDRDRIARQKKELLQGAEEEGAGEEEAEAPAAAAAQAAEEQPVVQPPAPPRTVDPLEILNVLRDPVRGNLAVRLMGETIRHPASLTPEQRVRLKNLLSEVEVWAGAHVEKKGLHPQAPPEPPLDISKLGDEAEQGTAPASFTESLPRRVEVTDVLPFRRSTIPKLDDAPPEPRSIAVQINAILQEMLARSSLAGREVRLYESADGALRIVDGEYQYTAVQAVDDPQVRALIQAAVKAWNQKNRPRGGSGS